MSERSALPTTYTLPIRGRAGIPVDVVSVSINITATGTTDPTFVTAYPGSTRPTASNLNPEPGVVTHNTTHLPVAADGSITLYNHVGSTDLVVDVLGYAVDASCFTAMAPTRLLDTRAGETTADGQHQGTGPLGAAATYLLPVRGRAAIPGGAVAVAINVTATGTTDPTFVTAYPGSTRPTASNLNPRPGSVTHNTTQLPIAADGSITLYNHVGSTDLVVDVLGYYASTTCFTATAPVRLLDTRPGETTVDAQHQGTGIMGAAATYTLPVRGRAGIPGAATAVAVNITATGTTDPTFVTAYPGSTRPTASNLNPRPGVVTHNTTQLPIAADGTITLYQHVGASHLVVDVLGYYTGGAGGLPPGQHPRIYLPGAQARLDGLLDADATSADPLPRLRRRPPRHRLPVALRQRRPHVVVRPARQPHRRCRVLHEGGRRHRLVRHRRGAAHRGVRVGAAGHRTTRRVRLVPRGRAARR